MAGSDILVSIVMPCYNYAPYLAQAIASVEQQTLTNWQLIVVNDGSTDNTMEVLEVYQNQPNIIVIDKPNGGVSSARNRGMAQATGKYIAFLDADDIWQPHKLEKVVTAMEAHNAWFGASDFGRFSATSEDFGKFSDYCQPLRALSATASDGVLSFDTPLAVFTETLEMPWYPSANVVLRAACPEQGFDESMKLGEDLDFFVRLWARGPAVFITEPLLKLRVHDANASKSSTNHTLLVLKILHRQQQVLPADHAGTAARRILTARIKALLGARGLLKKKVTAEDARWLKQRYPYYLRHTGKVKLLAKLVYNYVSLWLLKSRTL